MKLLKGFLFVGLGLFVMITLFSLLMPSRVVTTKAIVIHAPKEQIINAISNLENWKLWNPVFLAHSSQGTVSTTPTGAAQEISWQSNDKNYCFAITERFEAGLRLTLTAAGEKPTEHNIVVLPLPEIGNCQVEWTALSKLGWWPWQKFAGIFESQVTGPGYEQALQSLKKYLEEKPVSPAS